MTTPPVYTTCVPWCLTMKNIWEAHSRGYAICRGSLVHKTKEIKKIVKNKAIAEYATVVSHFLYIINCLKYIERV